MDKTRNLISMDNYSTLIPKEIIDEIGKENKIYGTHKQKYNYEKQIMLLNIYYDNDIIKRENIRAHAKNHYTMH